MQRSSIAFFLGLAGVLGLAPFAFWPVPIIAVALFFLLCQKQAPRALFRLGFFFGFGYFIASVSWIYVSLHTFGGMPAILAGVVTFFFCAFLGCFPGLAVYIAAIADRKQQSFFAYPLCWTAAEWLRGFLLTGFPWALIGYAQVPDGPLAPLAPIGGIYLLSLLTIMSAQALFLLVTKRSWQKPWLFFLILAVVSFVSSKIHWTEPSALKTIALVQGNVSQDIKWNPAHSAETLERYASLIEKSQASIIITPESAFPIFWNQLPPSYLERLLRHAKAKHADILLGVVEYENEEFYNSLVSIGVSGTQIYRKVHLVPFGEYVPWRPLTQWFMNLVDIPLTDFLAGEKNQPPLFIQGLKMAPNICYEDVFPEELISRAKVANFLVNISNDAWFGDSFAPFQHLQIAQARALEFAKPLLRVTNMGPSAFIDKKGQIIASIPYGKTGVLHHQLAGHEGTTPYALWGNAPVVILLLLWSCGQICGYLRKICG